MPSLVLPYFDFRIDQYCFLASYHTTYVSVHEYTFAQAISVTFFVPGLFPTELVRYNALRALA